ncbi:MAG: hypothetical protein LBD51_01135 [Bifidobacteriaceae bacterium]|nr:hypothetical protein [Bifidobacteriaceae bacterium]
MPGEAWRDVVSGTTRCAVWAGPAALVMAACAAFDMVQIDSLVRQAAEFEEAGASVRIIQTQRLVDGPACAAIGQQPFLEGGALREEPAKTAAAVLPSSPMATYSVTEGLLALVPVISDSGGAGVFVSLDAAEALGVGAGGSFQSTSGEVRVRGIFDWPQDGRRRGFGYAVLEPAAAEGAFDECWARMAPAGEDLSGLLAATLLPHDVEARKSVALSQLNSTLGERFDGAARLAERTSRWTWLVALAGCGILGFASVRSRKLELASDLHAGVGKLALIGLMALEAGWWAAVSVALAGAASGIVIGLGSGLAVGATATAALLVLGQGLVGALMGAVAGAASIREAALFRYAKSRQ